MLQGKLPGVTLDTGTLIALERRDRAAMSLIETAQEQDRIITVPAVVLTEWWRGQPPRITRLLEAFDVEQLTRQVAMAAGEALARTRGPSVVDAIVVASAAQRGDFVVTSDVGDLDQLTTFFPGVRIVGLGKRA